MSEQLGQSANSKTASGDGSGGGGDVNNGGGATAAAAAAPEKETVGTAGTSATVAAQTKTGNIESANAEVNAASADLMAVVESVMERCPWTGASAPTELVAFTHSELDEIGAELAATDPGRGARLQDELGDLLFDAFLLAATCRRDFGTDIGAAFRGAAAKVRRRCPHVFGEERAGSKAEAALIWQREKAKEKAAAAAAAT